MKLRALICLLLGTLLGSTASVGNCQTQAPVNQDHEGDFNRPVDWGWAISVAGDIDATLGHYLAEHTYWGTDCPVDPGVGLQVCLARSISRDVALRITFTDYGLDYRDDTYLLSHLNVRSVAFGFQVFRAVDRFRPHRLQTYASLDGGMIQTSTGGKSHTLLRPGGGVVLPIVGGLWIDIGAHIDVIWMSRNPGVDDTKSGLVPDAFIASLSAGLAWTI